MEKRLKIINDTNLSIDVYRSEADIVSLSHGSFFNCETDENMSIHVHSPAGSFVVHKCAAQYTFKKYGKLTMMTDQSEGCFAIHILEKH